MNTSYADQGYCGHNGRRPDGLVHPQEQYQFSLRLVMSSILQIDPALLHDNCEHGSFVHPKHWVEHENWPCSKKDVRPKASHKPKKGKGKGKARDTSSESESDADDARGKTCTGRSGVQNYNKGWKLVEGVYNVKAMSVGQPELAASSLKTKYQLYIKQKKPTSKDECPPEASTCDLDNDSKLENEDNNDTNDSDVPKVIEPMRSAVARYAASPPLRCSRTSAANTVNKIVHSLDPATLRRCDEARASHSFERAQLMTLSTQVDSLRNQISILQQENNDLKCKQDHANMEWTWAARLNELTRGSYDRSTSHHRCHGWGHTMFAELDGLQRVGGKVRAEHKYPDGGAVTFWETDASLNATDFDHRPKKKQCRCSPTPYHGRTPTPTPSPRRPRTLSRRRTPIPGLSHLPFTSNPTSDTVVSGNTIELIITPHCGGAPLRFIISPSVQHD
ncbi:hypothetical protein K438DRAFT_1991776 [Mycena galopus ATCC 62051]|nr:hypothetical protein K438DRAFT_1991776 [Mycena galopus ATCC 62051]